MGMNVCASGERGASEASSEAANGANEGRVRGERGASEGRARGERGASEEQGRGGRTRAAIWRAQKKVKKYLILLMIGVMF